MPAIERDQVAPAHSRLRLIAKQKKVKVNPHEDLEFTDWKALAGHIAAFRARLGGTVRKAG